MSDFKSRLEGGEALSLLRALEEGEQRWLCYTDFSESECVWQIRSVCICSIARAIRAVSMVYISNRVSDGVKVWSTCLSESDVVRSQTALYHCFSNTVAGEASGQAV